MRRLPPVNMFSSSLWFAGLLLAVILSSVAFGRNPDPKKGMQVFAEKGCARCHSVLGEGANVGPDLTRTPSAGDGLELAAAMWSHGPRMWQRMQQQKVTLPKFEAEEMEDLFAFLSMAGSLDERGEAEAGRRLFRTKRCVDCHAIRGQGAKIGPDLASVPSNRNPVGWIAAMWNHAPGMVGAMKRKGIPFPRFQGNEMADLQSYVRQTAGAQGQKAVYYRYLRPPGADEGEALFRTKQCVQCHSINGYGGTIGPDLSRVSLPRKYGQIALVLWNHAPQMHRMMSTLSIPQPQFQPQELADVLAYLSSVSMRRQGNPASGATIFAAKGCSGCHAVTAGAPRSVGPNLTGLAGVPTPIGIASTMWNHGPSMMQRMEQSAITWPAINSKELVDTLAYLKSIQVGPAANSPSMGGLQKR